MQPQTKQAEEDVLPNLTPRSEKACLLAGVEPRELVPLALEAFAEPGQPAALQQLKWQRYEDVRQDAFRAVQLERERILAREERDNASSVSEVGRSGMGGASSVLHEQRMVEKIKRRQQAEIEGMFLQEIKNLKVQEEKAERIRAAQDTDVRKQQERERRVRENAEARRLHDIEVSQPCQHRATPSAPSPAPSPCHPIIFALPRGLSTSALHTTPSAHTCTTHVAHVPYRSALSPSCAPPCAAAAHEGRGGTGARAAQAARRGDGEGVRDA